jgi:SAM-dependent methyltransferase
MKAPTERFSGRADNYVRYRPAYSRELVGFLRAQCGLAGSSVIADVGSGTGTLSRMLLDEGCTVYGIEPNAEMRASAERLLAGCGGFKSVEATAEETTLPDGSVDLVTAGRSVHWFDLRRALAEMGRILKPRGCAVALWNRRQPGKQPLAAGYEQILWTYCQDYAALDARRAAAMEELASAGFSRAALDYRKTFDRQQLRGQLLSLSVSPDEGDPRRDSMLAALDELFDRFQTDGTVVFDYLTTVFYGRPPRLQGPHS